MLEVDYFTPTCRPVDSEWQRRLDDQKEVFAWSAQLRKKVETHFGKRYYGDAFEEWIREIFDLRDSRLKECRQIARRHKTEARRYYRTDAR